ncbi:MAG: cell division protein FtsL [Acidobacteriaceae bacterium]
MAAAGIAIDRLREKGQWSAEAVMEHNRWLLAAQQRARRGPTPEVFFDKRLDNSRLVKAEDPVRKQEMRAFTVAAVFLFVLLMVYSCQHFSSIEYGYHIETEKAQLKHLQEVNRELGLTQAQLSRSERIDRLAHQIGMQAPQPGQVVVPSGMDSNSNAPILASVTLPDVPPNR